MFPKSKNAAEERVKGILALLFFWAYAVIVVLVLFFPVFLIERGIVAGEMEIFFFAVYLFVAVPLLIIFIIKAGGFYEQ
jgi:thiosulfate reductase cytochrome b subunit